MHPCRHYRQWHDVASQVAMSLFEFPAPTFMSLTFDCRTPEDEEILQECLTPILIMRRREWWNGFRKHCLGELDKDFRPKKLEIAGIPYSVDNSLSGELIDCFFDQVDLSYEADVLNHISMRETASELMEHFGKQTQHVINLKSQGLGVAEAAEQLGVRPETVKTLLKRA